MKKALNIPAPDHLSEKAKRLWGAIAEKRASSPERLALLQIGLEALDLADHCKRSIDQQGLTVETKRSGMSHLNPLLKTMRENQNLFVKVLNSLGLKFDPSEPYKFEKIEF